MIEKVARYMKQWQMIEPGGCVIAGVSGGADSVCLCLVLLELSKRMNFTLRVVHVEHGIRGEESVSDAHFVEQFCDAHGIECVVHSVNVPEYAGEHRMGEEEAARLLRYEAFRSEALRTPHSRIALAHHMEDNAETILFQLARGSGIDGMCGIRPVRGDEENVTYIRPLLCVSRQEIERELSERNQPYCLDATNDNLQYSRNRIRHKVLPELTAVNAQTVAHLNQTAEYMNELREYMQGQLQMAEERVVSVENDEIVLRLDALISLPNILKTNLVRNALARAGGQRRDLAGCHVEAVLGLIDKQSGRSVNLPHELVAEREYHAIRIRKSDNLHQCHKAQMEVSAELLADAARTNKPVHLRLNGQKTLFTMRVFPFEGNLSEIPRKIYTKWFDYDRIKNGFSIRTRRNQDYFVMDAKGHRQKLSDYFINEKIPLVKRDETWLMANGNEIYWIVGGRMGRTAQIESGTRWILEIVYEGGEKDGL